MPVEIGMGSASVSLAVFGVSPKILLKNTDARRDASHCDRDGRAPASRVMGLPICFNPLHELEFTNALHLKLFHRSATAAQVQAAAALVEADLKSGILLPTVANWEKIFRAATDLARPP